MANLGRDYYLAEQGLQTFVNEFETNVIAEEYSSSATYAVDAYCTHDNKLYRCTTAISTAEAWNSAHWTLVLISDELKSKKSGTVTSVTIKGTSPIVSSSESAITTSGTRTISHANSGVTAGTYKSVTVNATGHVTEGINPTTLSGYGITDAKITSGTIMLGSDSITPITSHQTVTDNNPTLDWGTQSKVATIGGTDIHVNLPDNPNTDTKVRQILIVTNYDRPLLMSAVNTSSTTQNIDNVAYRNNLIYANPSTGTLTATTFAGALQGNADTATTTTKLSNTTKIGDTNQPVYFSDQGVPESINYTIDKSVPADAVFTDTTYENKPAVEDGTDVSLVTTGDKYKWDKSSSNIISTASGNIATFSDGGDNIPLKSCEITIPANTQGISSVNIGVNGKNFYPLKVGRDLFADNRGASHTTNTDVLSITMDAQNNSGVYGGTGTAVNNTICQTIKKFSGSFVLSLYAKSNLDSSDVYFGFGAFGNTVVTLSTSWQRVELPLTLDSNIHTLSFYNRSGSAITVDVKDLQIELGQTSTTYEEFEGQTYTIPLGETLTQGGTLDAVSGLLTRTDTTTSQLTGVNIPTLSGLNNIYSNTGDVEVEYFNENANEVANLVRSIDSDYHIYSTDEHIVGKWIDGKPIYEKTIECGAIPDGASQYVGYKEVAHNISNLNKVIEIKGMAYSDTEFYPLPCTNSGSESLISSDILLYSTKTDIILITRQTWSTTVQNSFVTLRYTKS